MNFEKELALQQVQEERLEKELALHKIEELTAKLQELGINPYETL